MRNYLKFAIFGLLTLGACNTVHDKAKDQIVPLESTPLACFPSGLPTNVIAYYPFSEGLLLDFSGNNNHLSNTTSAKTTADRDGNTNCAYIFENTSSNLEFLKTSNGNFLNGKDKLSISLWYAPSDTLSDPDGIEALASRGNIKDCTSKIGSWSIGIYECSLLAFSKIGRVWENTSPQIDCEQNIIDGVNVWRHVVATYDASIPEEKLYLDGVFQDANSGNYNCGNQDIGDLFLGFNFTGKIDDILIFDKVLNDSEVTDLFDTEPCCL